MNRLMLIAGTALVAMVSVAKADGDAAAGEKVFKKCMACHAVGEGAKNKVGPQLNGIIGRQVATADGYKYSAAMIAYGEGGKVWDEEMFKAYVMNPKGTVPKNKMAFAGLKKEDDVVNVLAYLEQFSAH
ncbi:cytochrome c family protein [Stappia sp. F7233]|uniref:Cytochrome c family protein n=1 Tax=Stappia albiluteola TaxID=2758565 RepID=A0A839AK21_9HYPH|nr:cytochrome c family protein [Stappia albiluteola]MBA5779242.1 cytochrome c family protein [Stappia albiluteola]